VMNFDDYFKLVSDLGNNVEFFLTQVKKTGEKKTERIFSKLKAAIDAVEKDSISLKIYGQETIHRNKRIFMIKTENEIFSHIKKMEKEKGNCYFHEIVKKNDNVRFFFDIDLSTTRKMDFDKVCLLTAYMFQKFTKTILSTKLEIERDFSFMMANRNKKYSAHIVVHGQVICKDSATLQYIMEMFEIWLMIEYFKTGSQKSTQKDSAVSKYFETTPHSQLISEASGEIVSMYSVENGRFFSVVDMAVYKNGSLRTCWSCKRGDSNEKEKMSQIKLYKLDGITLKENKEKNINNFKNTVLQPSTLDHQIKVIEMADSKIVMDSSTRETVPRLRAQLLTTMKKKYQQLAQNKDSDHIREYFVDLVAICDDVSPHLTNNRKRKYEPVDDVRVGTLATEDIENIITEAKRSYLSSLRYKLDKVRDQTHYDPQLSILKEEKTHLVIGIDGGRCLSKIKRSGKQKHKSNMGGVDGCIYLIYIFKTGMIFQKCHSGSCKGSCTKIGRFVPIKWRITKKKKK